ncbi:MAG: crossover junction endodeoxyribonuclease RuvC [Chlamydiae bacterium]|nr:crossover junction endodeoxyribonuclease RuvC [Chlamydiota bacterium]
MHQPLVILGIDPGTAVTGYGVIAYKESGSMALDYGCIRPPTKQVLSQKYWILFNALSALVEKHAPHAMAVETQFVHKNPQGAIKLGMARCCAVLAAAKYGIPIYEYSPRKAKLAVVGQGSASKQQVQKMMQLLLQLPSPPEPEDAADALALALCHGHATRFLTLQGELL